MLNRNEETRAGNVDLDVAKTDPTCGDSLRQNIEHLALQMESKSSFFWDKFRATCDKKVLSRDELRVIKKENEYAQLFGLTSYLLCVLERLCKLCMTRKERIVVEEEIKKLEVLDKIIFGWNSYEQQLGIDFVNVIKGLLQIYYNKLDAMVNLVARNICPPDSTYLDCLEEELLMRKLNRMIKDSLNTLIKDQALQMKEQLDDILHKTISAEETKEQLTTVTKDLCTQLERLSVFCFNVQEAGALQIEIMKLEDLSKTLCNWFSCEQQSGIEFLHLIIKLLNIHKNKFGIILHDKENNHHDHDHPWDFRSLNSQEEVLVKKLNRVTKGSHSLPLPSNYGFEQAMKEPGLSTDHVVDIFDNDKAVNSLNTQMKYLSLQMKELDNMLCKTQFEISAIETKEQLITLMNDLCTQLDQLSVLCFNIQEAKTLQNEIKKLEDQIKIACNWYKCEHQSGIEFLCLIIKLLDIHRNKFGTMLRDKIKGKNHSECDHQWDFQSLNSEEEILMRKLKGMIHGSHSLSLPLSYSSGQASKESGASTDYVQVLANKRTTFLEFCSRAIDCPPELRVNLGLAFYAMLLGQLWAMGDPLDKLSKSTSTTEGTQASILSLRQAFSMFLPIIMWSAMFFWTFIGTALLVRSMPFKGPLVLILLLSLVYYVSVFASTGFGFIVHCGSTKMPSLLFALGGVTSFVLLIGFAVTCVLWVLHSKLGKTGGNVNLD